MTWYDTLDPRDSHAGAAAGQEVPTREAFRDAVDPDAVCSERELVALYVETYPPASSSALGRKRHSSLRRRASSRRHSRAVTDAISRIYELQRVVQ
ncbi:integrase family protein [Burkholderia lata]|uniref:hypothetical protein n=1 Tax=Burkholderia lata (strain ATCC 17760 / DSM 23089 / LMG 22485 / NCIMB 9086 / R18194 / 383) TaxID=482957 RepID=UPI00145451F1|nr:hypothetical protein [Burkholderia lata]VWC74873.1 integrase family protein [Burkholderia lata]